MLAIEDGPAVDSAAPEQPDAQLVPSEAPPAEDMAGASFEAGLPHEAACCSGAN